MSLCGTDKRTNDDEQLKIELLSQWKLEAESRNSDGNVDSSISGNSVEFSNSCECGASGESGSSVDSDKYFNLFNRQKSKFKICGR